MYKDFWRVIEYASDKKIKIGILGNPELLDNSVCDFLQRVGVDSYQLSLDGLEDTHDSVRYKGSFLKTTSAVHMLNQYGINSVAMFTVSKRNMAELLDVIRLVAEIEVKRFDFSRIVPIGNAKTLADIFIEPNEYRDLLYSVFDLYKYLKDKGYRTNFGKKESLWKLLMWEKGLLNPSSSLIEGGCGIGYNSISILPDGTVYACRRLPDKIGNLTETKFREIFLNPKTMGRFRRIDMINKCNKCKIQNYCRGCRAISYGYSGDYFAPDPQCWLVED